MPHFIGFSSRPYSDCVSLVVLIGHEKQAGAHQMPNNSKIQCPEAENEILPHLNEAPYKYTYTHTHIYIYIVPSFAFEYIYVYMYTPPDSVLKFSTDIR